jgi:hypothetical protein
MHQFGPRASQYLFSSVHNPDNSGADWLKQLRPLGYESDGKLSLTPSND